MRLTKIDIKKNRADQVIAVVYWVDDDGLPCHRTFAGNQKNLSAHIDYLVYNGEWPREADDALEWAEHERTED